MADRKPFCMIINFSDWSKLLRGRRTVLAGSKASVFAKSTVEICRIVKAALQGNFQNSVLVAVIYQQGNGFLNPFGHDVVPQRYSEEVLKQGGQIGRGDVDRTGNIGQCDRIGQVLVDIVQGIADCVNIFPLEGAGIVYQIMLPNQCDKEDVQQRLDDQ